MTVLQWCALCLVGHCSPTASLQLVEPNGSRTQVDSRDQVSLIREAAGVKQLLDVTGRPLNLALTTYGGTPVCAWHLDEEIGRRRLCR
jgi:hypothetical protein